MGDDVAAWVGEVLGVRPDEPDLFVRALTHSSHAGESYERLEFLGDRVLGLVMAEWLSEVFPDEPEGQLSKRFNALVTGAVCAEVARGIGAVAHVRLGKQARDDGAQHGDNLLGDVMEALLGALYRTAGLDAARAAIRRLWADRIHSDDKAPQHPKSALQEWAAANRRAVPAYELVDRSGPGHAPRFTVRVTVGKDEVSAEGTSKQEAETEAARALLEVLSTQAVTRRKRRR
ncbi:ribonuclease III [Sphingomonas sp. LR60]|uniref:ribonuclease III n=1 Tax=Sphingomonas sp. LR60 TaxID=3050233 RepID=UPI002FDF70CD